MKSISLNRTVIFCGDQIPLKKTGQFPKSHKSRKKGFKLIKTKIIVSSFLLFLMLIIGCAPKAEYLGKTYPPTTNVDFFMNANEIKKDYEVMGEMTVKGQLGSRNAEDMQAKLIEEAKLKGADAILIEELKEVVTGTTSTTTGSIKDNKKGTSYNEQTRTNESKDKILTAKLLKYK